jgi:hypothetical protein
LRRRYIIKKLGPEHDLFDDTTMYEQDFKLIVICASDNHQSHSVCATSKYIFDCNSSRALPMTIDGINCCCGKNADFEHIQFGYRFVLQNRFKAPEFFKKLSTEIATKKTLLQNDNYNCIALANMFSILKYYDESQRLSMYCKQSNACHDATSIKKLMKMIVCEIYANAKYNNIRKNYKVTRLNPDFAMKEIKATSDKDFYFLYIKINDNFADKLFCITNNGIVDNTDSNALINDEATLNFVFGLGNTMTKFGYAFKFNN